VTVRSTHRLQVVPVGWGFLSLHTVELGGSVAIVTDGGAVSPCYRELVRYPRLIHNLAETIESSDLIIWIISHFDYDHISLMSQLLKYTDRYADVCIIPFTYSVKVCREALATYIALITHEIWITIMVPRAPTFPETLQAMLRRCRRKVLMGRGSIIRVDRDVHYEFLWPDPNHISGVEKCKRIQEELKRKIDESCKRNRQACNELRETVDKMSGEVESIINKLIDDAELVKELDIRDILRQREGLREKWRANFLIDMQEITFRLSEDIEKCFLEALKKYDLREVKERLENVYSLAYVLRSSEPVNSEIEIMEGYDQPCILCTHTSRRFFSSGENILMYLGDLDDSSIGFALEGYVPTYVSILVPAHHGNRWHNVLSKIRARITYLNRCDIHKKEWLRRFRRKYLYNQGLIIPSGHRYYLYYLFIP